MARTYWGRDYEQDLQDVLQLQKEMATAVATEIAGKLIPQDQKRLNTTRIASPEAYEAYLRGRYFSTKEILRKASNIFRRRFALILTTRPPTQGWPMCTSLTASAPKVIPTNHMS